MTTFEIIVTVALIVIVMLLMRQTRRNTKANERNAEQFFIMCEILSNIRGDTLDIFQELNNIEGNNDQGFKKLTDIVDKMHRNLCVEIADKMVDRIYPDKESMNKIDWDKLSKEQQDEFLKRLILPNYDKPTQPIYTPCYAPDGICMNPFRDCINCPRRGDGGTWSTNTSINAEDAPLQEWFNNNKKD